MSAFSDLNTRKKRKMISNKNRNTQKNQNLNLGVSSFNALNNFPVSKGELNNLGNLGFIFNKHKSPESHPQPKSIRSKSAPANSSSTQPTIMSNRQTKIRDHQRNASISFYNIREILVNNYGQNIDVKNVKKTPNYKILQIIENVLNDNIDKNKKIENESYNRIREILVKNYGHNKDIKDYSKMPNHKVLNLIEDALIGTKNSMNKDIELSNCYKDNKILLKELAYFKEIVEADMTLSKMHPTNLKQYSKQLFYNNQELFHENMHLKQMCIQAGILHPRTTFRSIGMNGTSTPTPSHSSTSR